jgi:thiamine pyrophosphate-dependent acetolactate synthase large subunit-like protein
MAPTVKVYATVARVLARQGVDTLFGVLGEGNLLLVEELVRAYRTSYVAAAREDGAISMAVGYARLSGRVGVCTVTHGPGLTNCVTALTEATRSRTPLLLLAGETAAGDPHNLQSIDQQVIVRPTGAGWQPLRPPEPAEAVLRALRQAETEQRPVVLSMPADYLASSAGATTSWPDETPRQPGRAPLAADELVIDAALGIVAAAHRTLVLAGWGAVRSGAREDLLALARLIGAPVATTLPAKGLFAGQQGDLGIFGTLSSAQAAAVIARADCILAFGASLNQHTSAGGAYLHGKAVIQCDADADRIGRWGPVDVPVIGDAALVARTMIAALRKAGHSPPSGRAAEIAGLGGAADPDPFEDESTTTTVDMRSFMQYLDQVLPAERTVVTDGGHFMAAPWLHLGVPEGGALLPTVSFAAVGLGLATAVGAARARPDRLTVAVVGDGGLMMSLSELSTATRLGLRMLVVVLNDSAYGAEYHALRLRLLDTSLSRIWWPDLAPVAAALGAASLTVRSADDFPLVMRELGRAAGPVFVDAKVDPGVRIGFFD